MIGFELIITGGIGSGLLAAYPELGHLRMSHVRLVVTGEPGAREMVARLERAGLAASADLLCADRQFYDAVD